MAETVEPVVDSVEVPERPRQSGETQRTPIWLAHHHSGECHRCVEIAGWNICRRCVWVYPSVVLAAAVLGVSGWKPGGATVALGISALLIAFLVDWTLEHLGRIDYSPLRQVAVSLPAGVAGGLALSVHLRSPFAPEATVPIVVCGIVAGSIALWSKARESVLTMQATSWEQGFEADEERRMERLRSLAGESALSANKAKI